MNVLNHEELAALDQLMNGPASFAALHRIVGTYYKAGRAPSVRQFMNTVLAMRTRGLIDIDRMTGAGDYEPISDNGLMIALLLYVAWLGTRTGREISVDETSYDEIGVWCYATPRGRKSWESAQAAPPPDEWII